jgi:hypothetical protein
LYQGLRVPLRVYMLPTTRQEGGRAISATGYQPHTVGRVRVCGFLGNAEPLGEGEKIMAEFTEGDVQANRLRFHYLEMGEGPLALCLHGFPDSPYSYRSLLPELAEAGYRAVAPFNRGFAPTELPAERHHVHSSTMVDDALSTRSTWRRRRRRDHCPRLGSSSRLGSRRPRAGALAAGCHIEHTSVSSLWSERVQL